MNSIIIILELVRLYVELLRIELLVEMIALNTTFYKTYLCDLRSGEWIKVSLDKLILKLIQCCKPGVGNCFGLRAASSQRKLAEGRTF